MLPSSCGFAHQTEIYVEINIGFKAFVDAWTSDGDECEEAPQVT